MARMRADSPDICAQVSFGHGGSARCEDRRMTKEDEGSQGLSTAQLAAQRIWGRILDLDGVESDAAAVRLIFEGFEGALPARQTVTSWFGTINRFSRPGRKLQKEADFLLARLRVLLDASASTDLERIWKNLADAKKIDRQIRHGSTPRVPDQYDSHGSIRRRNLRNAVLSM